MFGKKFFDFIYFGFCLYLVDRNLINDSLSEANRCLKPGGFLAIKDFDYGSTHVNKYKHKKSMKSFKEDYTDYFIKLGYKLVSKESYVSQKIGFQIETSNALDIIYSLSSDETIRCTIDGVENINSIMNKKYFLNNIFP